MQAHDSILATCVKQTHDANCRRCMTPFVNGDLCYVSTANISFPKGYARKFVPKYIGPYKILEDLEITPIKLIYQLTLIRGEFMMYSMHHT